MEECMNGNNVCARLRLVSICVFPKVVATMCVFSKAWCKMHGWINSNAEGTSANTTEKKSPPGDYGESRSVWSGDRHDVLRMHGQWFQKKKRAESWNQNQNQNPSRLTPKGQRRRRWRCRRKPDINQQRRKDTDGWTRQRRPKRHNTQ